MIIIKFDNHVSQDEAMIRSFSELFNNIRDRGEQCTIMRGRKPAAGSVKERKLSNLKDIMRNLFCLEDDGEVFERDNSQTIMV
jgi:hypothetical protein